MYKILIITLLTCFSCSTSKKVSENQAVQLKNNLYYINCTLFPKNSHTINMAGLGNFFNNKLLEMRSLENFQEAFYKQLIYTPLLESSNYLQLLNCLGFDYNNNWDKQFYEKYVLSEKIDTYKLKLEDGNYLTIDIYKVVGEVKPMYTENLKCITSNSLEANVKQIKTVNKMAVLVPISE